MLQRLSAALVRFKSQLAGAIERLLSDKLSERVSILDFGADPTGVKDSTAAIQAAIDAVYARGGGELFIPASIGTGSGDNVGYKVSDSIRLKPYVNIQGEGFGSLLKATKPLPDGILVMTKDASITGKYIRDIRLQGVGGKGTIGLSTNLVATATSEEQCYGYDISCVVVELCEIGMQLQGLWHSTIRNCTTSSCRLGLHLWGQNVSIQITGCHFRRDHWNEDLDNTFGIRIQPRVYAWSPDQVGGSRSEAIVINGETMCISVHHGIYVDDCLDLQISNVDLDYIRGNGVAIINVNGGFSLVHSWIAADSSSTSQFIGVNLNGNTLQQHKALYGLHINANSANPASNNICINIEKGAGKASIKDCTLVNGWAGVVIMKNMSNIIIDGTLFGGNELYMVGTGGNTVTGCALHAITDSSKQGVNTYSGNNGLYTGGIVEVKFTSGAAEATLSLPNTVPGAVYGATVLASNVANITDAAWVEGSVVHVKRVTPVGVPLNSVVQVSML